MLRVALSGVSISALHGSIRVSKEWVVEGSMLAIPAAGQSVTLAKRRFRPDLAHGLEITACNCKLKPYLPIASPPIQETESLQRHCNFNPKP